MRPEEPTGILRILTSKHTLTSCKRRSDSSKSLTSFTASGEFVTTSAQPMSKNSTVPWPPCPSQVHGRTIPLTSSRNSSTFLRYAALAFSPVSDGDGTTSSSTQYTLVTWAGTARGGGATTAARAGNAKSVNVIACNVRIRIRPPDARWDRAAEDSVDV